MTTPFAINGLGRVGRALLRAIRSDPERFAGLELVAVNDVVPAATLARLLARDTLYGVFPGEPGTVAAEGDALLLEGRRVPVLHHPEPGTVPWSSHGARIVVEASGSITRGSEARRHLGGTVERVVAAWNPEPEAERDAGAGVDWTVCLGINETEYDPSRHRVISNASCTTNAIAPVVKVLEAAFGVRHGLVNTIHGYTGNQQLLDGPHSEARRMRSATLNLIPVPTRAAVAVAAVLPSMAGKLDGFGVRVPSPSMALLDVVVELEQPATPDAVREPFRQAAAGPLRGILAVTEEELVSSDFLGNPHSAIVDLPLIQSIASEGSMLRVAAWYDNESGYAHRLAELLVLLARGAG
jgi:glyceraldehyde 3-phosphate dehydrogenase